ncbi:hypothetical protein Tco_1102920 [Tanacetum coccineum]
MGIPNEHQLKFYSIKDAKSLLQAIKKRFGGNATTKKTQRNLLKHIYENFIASSSRGVIYKSLITSKSLSVSWKILHGESILRQEDIINHRRGMDLRWQMAMQPIDGKEILEETLRIKLMLMEPRNRNKENTRKVVPVETTTSNALMSCDGAGYDWSDQTEECPNNFTLMAYSSTSSNSSLFEEDIKVLKREIHLREVAITELRRKLDLAQKQKDEIQLTVENFKNSSNSLSKLIDCQIVKSTTGGCQFLRSRLISWQCKKQTVVANSTTKAKYLAASSCCG